MSSLQKNSEKKIILILIDFRPKASTTDKIYLKNKIKFTGNHPDLTKTGDW